MAKPVRVVGLGGSLRVASTSRTALQAALAGAAAGGADVQLIWVRAARATVMAVVWPRRAAHRRGRRRAAACAGR